MNKILARFIYRTIQTIRQEPVIATYNFLKKSQWFSYDQLSSIQWERLKKLLNHCYFTVPYYQRIFKEIGAQPEDIKSITEFQKLPILTKHLIQQNESDLQSSCPKSRYRVDTTAGSTGTPLRIRVDRNSWAYHHGNIFRALDCYGIELGEPRATIWGRRLDKKSRIVYRLRDKMVNKIRLSSQNVENESMNFFCQLKHHKANHIYGYTSSIKQFANQIINNLGLDGKELALKAVVCTADNLSELDRQFLSEVFACPIINLYGATEVGIIGYECQDQKMHIALESILIELAPENDGIGLRKIIVTDLHNSAMPILRYSIEDLASDIRRNCTCGRGLPVLTGLAGRSLETIKLPNGKAVHPTVFTYIFKELAKKSALVGQFQFVRKASTIFVCYLAQSKLSTDDKGYIKEKFYEIFGDGVTLEIETVEQVRHMPSGKLSYYIDDWRGD